MIYVKILFWVCTFLILHSYIFFPFILRLLYSLKQKNKTSKSTNSALIPQPNIPTVACLISVYNEEKVIQKKIESLITGNYPLEKLDIYVGSDCSSDNTNTILKELEERYLNVKVFCFLQRRGKASVINDLLDQIESNQNEKKYSLYLFTDASVYLEKDTINKLVRHFENPEIALADAHIIPQGVQSAGISNSEKTYLNSEMKVKFLEGELWGMMMGVFGGCFMIRREMTHKLPSHFVVDDFYLSMKVLEQGGKAIYDMEADCYEGIPGEMREEFKRKLRISSGNYQNLACFKHFLLSGPWQRAFCFFSHKVLRWIGPFLMIGMLLGSFVLAYSGLLLYLSIFLSLAGIMFIIPLLDKFLLRMNIHISYLRHINYFFNMNFALFLGFIRYCKGIQSGTWEPPKRNV